MNRTKSILWMIIIFMSLLLLTARVLLSEAEAQQQDCAEALVSRLTPGMTVALVDTTSLSMLDLPDAQGVVIATISQGALLSVIDGPICFEGQWMWQVNYVDRVGWVTENAQQAYVLQPFDESPDDSGVFLDAPGLIAYNGVTFESPAELGSSISARTISAPDTPRGRELTFEDVPSDGLPARVSVWQVEDYRQYGIDAEQNIMQLEALVTEGRELSGRQPAGSLPFLPQPEGGMTFAVQARGLAFRNGSGVRYVTHFSSVPDLVRPYSYLYTYQGLTSDGAYYVSVMIPLTSELPEHGMIDFSRPGVYDQYIDRISDELDAFVPTQFTPSLILLDDLITTLEVGDVGIDLPIENDRLTTRLNIGDRARITPGVSNNLRQSASTSAARIGLLPAGAIFVVVDGPIYAEGYIWYQVNYQGRIGWTVETDGDDYFAEPID